MKYLWILAVLLLAVLLILILLLRRKSSRNTPGEEAEAKAALTENIKQFSGCFQPLFQAVQAKNTSRAQKYLGLWKERTADYPALSGFFDSVCAAQADPLENAKAWIQTLERWEIRHDLPGSSFTITREHDALYLFDDVYQVGDSASVVRPAWWIQADGQLICIETGAAEIE